MISMASDDPACRVWDKYAMVSANDSEQSILLSRCIASFLPSSFDRIEESFFSAEKLMELYHHSNEFRWVLCSFLKCIKEIPRIIQMEMQNQSGFPKWFSEKRDQLNSDPLMSFLSKQRDVVVHREMLIPNSSGLIGVTEGRGLKLGFRFPINPVEDSEEAMVRYLEFAALHGDVSMVLRDDEDAFPCVWRKWCLSGFDEVEIVELAHEALGILANVFADVIEWTGQARPAVTIKNEAGQMYRAHVFDREELKRIFGNICNELKVEPKDFWGFASNSGQSIIKQCHLKDCL